MLPVHSCSSMHAFLFQASVSSPEREEVRKLLFVMVMSWWEKLKLTRSKASGLPLYVDIHSIGRPQWKLERDNVTMHHSSAWEFPTEYQNCLFASIPCNRFIVFRSRTMPYTSQGYSSSILKIQTRNTHIMCTKCCFLQHVLISRRNSRASGIGTAALQLLLNLST